MGEGSKMTGPVFPPSSYSLRDASKCPNCFNPSLGARVCPSCALALDDPALTEVFEHSLAAASALEAREQSLRAITFRQAEARATALTTERARQFQHHEVAASAAWNARLAHTPSPLAPVTQERPSTAEVSVNQVAAPVGSVVTATPMPPAMGVPAPAMPTATPTPAQPTGSSPVGRARSGVQLTLLGTGIIFLAIAATVFLTVAFFMFSLAVKAAIVATITAAVIGLASWLKRRELDASAEGIAVLGVVLLYLDAWAAHSLNLANLGLSDLTTYWGAAGLLLTAVTAAWGRLTRLSVPVIAASFSALPALAFLVIGITRLTNEQLPAVVIGAGLAAASGLPTAFLSQRRKLGRFAPHIVMWVAVILGAITALNSYAASSAWIETLCCAAAGGSLLSYPSCCRRLHERSDETAPLVGATSLVGLSLVMSAFFAATVELARSLAAPFTAFSAGVSTEMAAELANSSRFVVAALAGLIVLLVVLWRLKREPSDELGLQVGITQVITALASLVPIGLSLAVAFWSAPVPYAANRLGSAPGLWWVVIVSLALSALSIVGATTVAATRPYGPQPYRNYFALPRTGWFIAAVVFLFCAVLSLPRPANTWGLVALIALALTAVATLTYQQRPVTFALVAVGVGVALAVPLTGIGSMTGVLLPLVVAITLLTIRMVRTTREATAFTAIAVGAIIVAYLIAMLNPQGLGPLPILSAFAAPAMLSILPVAARSPLLNHERILVAAVGVGATALAALRLHLSSPPLPEYATGALIVLAAQAGVTALFVGMQFRGVQASERQRHAAAISLLSLPIGLATLPAAVYSLRNHGWNAEHLWFTVTALLLVAATALAWMRRSDVAGVITLPAEALSIALSLIATLLVITFSSPHEDAAVWWIVATILTALTICGSHPYRTHAGKRVSMVPWLGGLALAVLGFAGTARNAPDAPLVVSSWGLITAGTVASLTQLAVRRRFTLASQVFAICASSTLLYVLVAHFSVLHDVRFAPQLMAVIAVVACFGFAVLPNRAPFTIARWSTPLLFASIVVLTVTAAVVNWPIDDQSRLVDTAPDLIPHLAWVVPTAALLAVLPLIIRLNRQAPVTRIHRTATQTAFLLSRITAYGMLIVVAGAAEPVVFGSVLMSVVALALVTFLHGDAERFALPRIVAVSTSVVAVAVPFAGFLYDRSPSIDRLFYGYAAPLIAVMGAILAVHALRERLERWMVIPFIVFTAVTPLLIPALAQLRWGTLAMAGVVSLEIAIFLVVRRAHALEHAHTLAGFSLAYPAYVLATRIPYGRVDAPTVAWTVLVIALAGILVTFAVAMTRGNRILLRSGSGITAATSLISLSYQPELWLNPHVPVLYALAALGVGGGVATWLLLDAKTPQHRFEPHGFGAVGVVVAAICAIAHAPRDFAWAYPAAAIALIIAVGVVALAAVSRSLPLRTRETLLAVAGSLAVTATVLGFAAFVNDPDDSDFKFFLPLGAACIAFGVLGERFYRTRVVADSVPRLRSSWLWYGPGSLLLGVTATVSELAELTDVRIGIATMLAAGLLIAGAVARLQAPFLIGLGVSVIQIFVLWNRFIPDFAVPWWVWLAIAGTLLVAFAITYEARMRDLRRIWHSFRQLR